MEPRYENTFFIIPRFRDTSPQLLNAHEEILVDTDKLLHLDVLELMMTRTSARDLLNESLLKSCTQKQLSFEELRESKQEDQVKSQIRSPLIGRILITNYNNMAYILCNVCFESSPLSALDVSSSGTMTFLDYYRYRLLFRKQFC